MPLPGAHCREGGAANRLVDVIWEIYVYAGLSGNFTHTSTGMENNTMRDPIYRHMLSLQHRSDLNCESSLARVDLLRGPPVNAWAGLGAGLAGMHIVMSS